MYSDGVTGLIERLKGSTKPVWFYILIASVMDSVYDQWHDRCLSKGVRIKPQKFIELTMRH